MHNFQFKYTRNIRLYSCAVEDVEHVQNICDQTYLDKYSQIRLYID